MNEFLQVIGSIASIGGIPLAIYLYLRSREAKFIKLRNDIVKILSYQIGEGRNLSVFEIKAVIDSKVREANGKAGTIESDEIIEDLVTETISSPLLNSERKDEILKNLRENHRNSTLFKVIDEKYILLPEIIKCFQDVDVEHDQSNEIMKLCMQQSGVEVGKEKLKRAEKTSDVFGAVAGLLTMVGVSLSLFGEEKFTTLFSTFINDNKEYLDFFFGVVASLIATVFALIFERFISNRGRRKIEKSVKNNS